MPGMACIRDDTPFDASASGVSLSIDVEAVLQSSAAARQLSDKLQPLLFAGEGFSVVFAGLVRHARPDRAFAALCKQLRCMVERAGSTAPGIGIVIDGRALEPQAAWETRQRWLGRGPLFLDLTHVPQDYWPQLWALRTNRMLRPVYASTVTSRCRLLSAEPAAAVLPGADIQAPAGSAWVTMSVDAASYTSESALVADLRRAVEAGERIHQRMRWPTPNMRHDAWLNRRLAINLVGLGDHARKRGIDPRGSAGLVDFRRLLKKARDAVQRQSRLMAGEEGRVPALEGHPGRALPGGSLRDGWDRRWRAAVEAHGVRHRNLLVLQPWSVLPSDRPADFRYASLLSLLQYADACSFPRPPSIAHWNVNEFMSFHQSARAALHQRDAGRQIAEHA